jgi:type IV pilus assembly protein PilM
MNSTYFYHDKPLFGLDIGSSSLKVMQVQSEHKKQTVCGYGITNFDNSSIVDGVITEPEKIAKSLYDLFNNRIIGKITTRRVAMAIPAAKTFARTVTLPAMEEKDIPDAVRLEAEQYIPLPVDSLYLDYVIIAKNEKEIELLAVAVPKVIVDSYMELAAVLGLEVVALETTISAATRLFVQAEKSDIPTILIDYGSISSDITVFDKTLIVTGTVPGGGDSFTEQIAKTLGVTKEEAHIIKTKYGLGISKKQKEIVDGLKSLLEQHQKELRRIVRYFEERNTNQKKIGQIVTMGGGANMPGLAEYMTDKLRLPVRTIDPWTHLDFKGLDPPHVAEKSMHVTVAGLALLKPSEAFVS